MIPLKKTDRATLRVIREWQEKYKNSPCPTEIAHEIGKSTQTVRYALSRLAMMGYIDMIRMGRRYLIVPLYWE